MQKNPPTREPRPAIPALDFGRVDPTTLQTLAEYLELNSERAQLWHYARTIRAAVEARPRRRPRR